MDPRLHISSQSNCGLIHVANLTPSGPYPFYPLKFAEVLAQFGRTLFLNLDPSGIEPSSSQFPLQGQLQKLQKDLLLNVGSPTHHNTTLDCLDINIELGIQNPEDQVQNFWNKIVFWEEQYQFIVISSPLRWSALVQSLFLKSDVSILPVYKKILPTPALQGFLKYLQALVKTNPTLPFRFLRISTSASDADVSAEIPKTWHHAMENLVLDLQTKWIPKSFAVVQEISSEEIPQTIPSFKSTWALISGCSLLLLLFLLIPARKTVYTSTPSLLLPNYQEKMLSGSIFYTFSNSESLTRVAKYAIARHCAVVPTQRQINEYISDVLAWHRELHPHQKIPVQGDYVPSGTTLEFFQPRGITNPEYALQKPAFDYFMSTVEDPFTYVTGVWAERGTGGMPRHEGIDVAATFGSVVRAPQAGIVSVQDLGAAGRTVSLVMGKHLLLFAHLDQRFVKSGQRVEAGTPLGTVGMTGRTSGPHVHIGYGIESPSGSRIGNRYYKFTDPMLWFYRQSFQKSNT